MQQPAPLGDILKTVERKTRRAKRALKGRRLAQRIISDALGDKAKHANVAHVKAGVVTVEADSPAFFQELEGFQREEILAALCSAGMNVSTLRVRLAEN